MPTIEVNDAELFYDEAGSGSETIVFAHSLLFSGRMFDEQISALKDRYRCVTFDFRGQGRSRITPDGYDMDSLYEDTAKLIEQLECAPCHFVGFSMGGFIALRLVLRRPDLVKSIILIDTSAEPELKKNLRKYRLLNMIARRFGTGAVARYVMPILFSQNFLRDSGRAEQRRRWRHELAANDRMGITRAVTGVITRQGVYDQLDSIGIPTLIIVGENDVATPPEMSERMHARIPESRLEIIPEAGHMTPIEQPGALNDLLEEFFNSLSS